MKEKGDTIVDADEYIRDGATIEAMGGLKPAFKKDGTVTAVLDSGERVHGDVLIGADGADRGTI